jgi:hypothetical protein
MMVVAGKFYVKSEFQGVEIIYLLSSDVFQKNLFPF